MTAKGDKGISDELTDRIIKCVITVHQALGPGFKESVYRHALLIEFHDQGIKTETEKHVTISYKERTVGIHKLDILVEGKVIVELKCADQLCRDNYAQVRSYLNATKLNKALLINFQTEKADFRRIER